MFRLSGLCFCAFMATAFGSAIPMWEFLKKEEKTSYIYSLFANQVENFCDSTTLQNCNQVLLKYGLNSLKNMPEEQLDAMDPYQRDANKIIWESMLVGHPLMRSTPKPKPTTTVKPNSYDDQSDAFDFGSESAASAKIDNVYVVLPPKDFVYKAESGKPQYTAHRDSVTTYVNSYRNPEKSDGVYVSPYQGPERKVATYISSYQNPEKIVKGAFTRFQEQYRPVDVSTEKIVMEENGSSTTETIGVKIPGGTYIHSNGKPMDDLEMESYPSLPLTGPMVVKVYLDGTPVRESTEMPQDEDLRQYKMSKVKLPTF